MGKFWHAMVAVLMTVGCNDSLEARNPSDALGQREAAERELASAAVDATPKAPKKSDDDKPVKEEPKAEDPSGFDADMAKTMIERARKQAVQCPNVAKDTPVGEGEITLTWDGKTGKIADVDLGSNFTRGSKTGQDCLKAAFVGQMVTNFQGQKKQKYTLTVPPPAAEKDDAKGKKKP